jgi:hypothetical protein
MDSFENRTFGEDDIDKIYTEFRRISEDTGAYYMAYVSEDLNLNIRCGFTSNPDWQKRFIGDNLIEDCHLWKEVTKEFIHLKKKSVILPWDTVRPETKKQKSILWERTDHEIGINGISFCATYNNIREYIAFAPGLNHQKFLLHLAKNMKSVRQAILIFRQISKKMSFTALNIN